MIDDAHLIGLGIAYTELDLVLRHASASIARTPDSDISRAQRFSLVRLLWLIGLRRGRQGTFLRRSQRPYRFPGGSAGSSRGNYDFRAVWRLCAAIRNSRDGPSV